MAEDGAGAWVERGVICTSAGEDRGVICTGAGVNRGIICTGAGETEDINDLMEEYLFVEECADLPLAVR